jgi:Xaa-Pro aminopeptidase
MNRHTQINEALKKHHLDAFLSTKGPNMQYLTGFTGGEGIALILHQGHPILLVDGRYTNQAKTQAFPGVEVIEYQPKHLWELIAAQLEGATMVGLEAETHLSLYQRLLEQISDKKWLNTPDFFEKIRIIKEADEISLLKKAAIIANESYLSMLHHVKPGITEAELGSILEFEMKKRGGQKSSFDIIVASGKRSAMPHGVASEKLIEHGDLITFDFGVFFQGYASDTTRTVSLGKPSDPDAEKVYAIVLEAQKKAIDQVRENVSCSEIDQLARKHIESQGYGDYFKHSTGHGIGLEIHELPRVSYECQTLLQSGMAITVEPGIYLDDRFGVRIEDSLVVTEDACINLTSLDKEVLQII